MPSSACSSSHTSSLHDALPILFGDDLQFLDAFLFVTRDSSQAHQPAHRRSHAADEVLADAAGDVRIVVSRIRGEGLVGPFCGLFRSEEHTSELQSLRHLVCRLLLAPRPTPLPYTTLFRSCSATIFSSLMPSCLSPETPPRRTSQRTGAAMLPMRYLLMPPAMCAS